MGLHVNWFKSYDKNEKTHKNAKITKNITQMRSFLTKSQKPRNENICILCHNFWTNSAPQNDRLNLSFAKDIHVNVRKLARNGCKTAICQSQILVYSLYYSTVLNMTLQVISKFIGFSVKIPSTFRQGFWCAHGRFCYEYEYE